MGAGGGPNFGNRPSKSRSVDGSVDGVPAGLDRAGLAEAGRGTGGSVDLRAGLPPQPTTAAITIARRVHTTVVRRSRVGTCSRVVTQHENFWPVLSSPVRRRSMRTGVRGAP